ncbi:MAG: FAD-dependent oxidoreductase [Thermoleophilia bacterium]|nr:FAD-dependent oxidoreductase [Thermoleophilia bacterium]
MSPASSTRLPEHRPTSMRRVVIVGAGVAGVEAALALAIAHPTAQVMLIGSTTTLRLPPDLVYVPFGVEPTSVEVPLQRALARFGIVTVLGGLLRVDAVNHVVELADRSLGYDALVIATGARPVFDGSLQLRSLRDARRVGSELAAFAVPAARRRSIVVHAPAASTWSAPAFEFAVLLDAWLRACGTRDAVDVVVTHAGGEPLDQFGPEASDLLQSLARQRRIELLGGRGDEAFGGIDSDLVIEFPLTTALAIPGLPALDANGFQAVAGRRPDGITAGAIDFEVAPDVYVIGDGNSLPIKTAFAAAWEARALALHLGGRPELLCVDVDDVPFDRVTYELDLVTSTLSTTFDAASRLLPPFVDPHVDARIIDRAPRKLAGSLIRQHLLGRTGIDASAQAFRAIVAKATASLPA